MAYFYLALAIVAEVTATFCLTLSNGFTRLAPSCVTVLSLIHISEPTRP